MTLRTKTILSILIVILVFSGSSCSKKADTNPDLPNADQYFTWNLNGTKGALLSPNDSLASARYSTDTQIAGASTTNPNGVTVIFRSDRTTGTFTASTIDLYIDKIHYWASPNAVQFKVTQYGSVGDYLVGSYSGTVPDSTSNTKSISGNFRLKTR